MHGAVEKAGERLTANPDKGSAGSPGNRPEAAQREVLASQVGIGAVKFADLSSYRTSGYIYDADRMVSFEGRTGPYVQYACVRIGSILKRAKTLDMAPGPIVVAEPVERALVLECARFPDVVACASTGLAPNEIAEYVYSLAQAFSRFYLECPVIVAEREPVRASRLAISALSLRVLTQGLFLLGIAVPDRM
jgi:arginyl-tRNA synthetase